VGSQVFTYGLPDHGSNCSPTLVLGDRFQVSEYRKLETHGKDF
jgi:hypothetical protein